MKTLLFYCQHILGIGHLVRSMELVRGLSQDFQIYFVNGGEVVHNFPIPIGTEVINLPAIKTDNEFQALQAPLGFETIDAALDARKQQLLNLFDRVQPDVVMVELFPFGRRRFSAELLPLLDRARMRGTKVVCSLRDIVVTKQDQIRHEAKICKLMNRYFDLLLIHGDPDFMPLEKSFSRISDLTCAVHYTGYVVQANHASPPNSQHQESSIRRPFILTSVGGGRFGHDLLDCIAQTSALLDGKIPHHIQLFTGPFSPDSVFERLQAFAQQCQNLTVERYTPHLMDYMTKADLSISMAGYNTTLNVLQAQVKAMLLPFQGNGDQEQRLRAERLEHLGVATVIRPQDLHPAQMAERIVETLHNTPNPKSFDFEGVHKTAALVKTLVDQNAIAA